MRGSRECQLYSVLYMYITCKVRIAVRLRYAVSATLSPATPPSEFRVLQFRVRITPLRCHHHISSPLRRLRYVVSQDGMPPSEFRVQQCPCHIPQQLASTPQMQLNYFFTLPCAPVGCQSKHLYRFGNGGRVRGSNGSMVLVCIALQLHCKCKTQVTRHVHTASKKPPSCRALPAPIPTSSLLYKQLLSI